ncbi:MAG: sigma-70 family RNA polymerase sigma factor [Bacteroidetes bacterium]|nr:sigma-70 family RNA polymerase sigma factor [Bacteroidota bacterium]
MEEAQLVNRLKQQDRKAFEYLYDNYSGALYGVVLRVVRNEDIAQEVLQDAFLKIWDRIASYDEIKGRLFTWMLHLTRNLAIDRTRSKEMNKNRKTDDLANLVHKVENQEKFEMTVDALGMREVIERLPAEQKFVIEHLYLKGYTQSELADEFQIPLGTVKTRTRLALKELRTILKED